MKPKISDFALATSLAVASISGSAAPIYEPPTEPTAQSHHHPSGTAAPLLTQPSAAQDIFAAQRHALFAQLMSYIPGAGDPGIVSSIEDIVTAVKIIRAIPSEFPLPTLMRDDEGQIGMYWDDRDLYLDINIEENSTFSFFSRRRSTNVENFADEIQLSELDHSWFKAQLGTSVRS